MVKKFELICNEIKDCTVSTQDWDWVLQDWLTQVCKTNYVLRNLAMKISEALPTSCNIIIQERWMETWQYIQNLHESYFLPPYLQLRKSEHKKESTK
jgi:hypothetical protein